MHQILFFADVLTRKMLLRIIQLHERAIVLGYLSNF